MFLKESLLLTKAALYSKNSKNSEILLECKTAVFYVNICYNVIYFCDQSCIFSIITPVFSVTWCFRNHYNMLICCSRNISDYYQCWKQLCCTIFLWKLWCILFFRIHRWIESSKITKKMAPSMAATVLSSPVFVLFLFVFPVFCFSNTISFTRDELLNIRQNTPQNLLPDFDYSNVLLNVVVGGAAAPMKRFRTCRRGKQAGALVKLRQRGFRTALPSIHLANLRSLPNKTDKLLLLSRINKDFSNSAALCFTETWLNDAIPDSALSLPGFQLFRADRDTESTGKSRGGGTCFYINERWCTDVTVKEDVLSRSWNTLH